MDPEGEKIPPTGYNTFDECPFPAEVLDEAQIFSQSCSTLNPSTQDSTNSRKYCLNMFEPSHAISYSQLKSGAFGMCFAS